MERNFFIGVSLSPCGRMLPGGRSDLGYGNADLGFLSAICGAFGVPHCRRPSTIPTRRIHPDSIQQATHPALALSTIPSPPSTIPRLFSLFQNRLLQGSADL